MIKISKYATTIIHPNFFLFKKIINKKIRNHQNIKNGIGTFIAILGVAMYSYIKAKMEEEKRQSKAA